MVDRCRSGREPRRDPQLVAHVYSTNEDTIGPDPSLIIAGQRLEIKNERPTHPYSAAGVGTASARGRTVVHGIAHSPGQRAGSGPGHRGRPGADRGHGHLVGGSLPRSPLRRQTQRDDRPMGPTGAAGEDRPPLSAARRGGTHRATAPGTRTVRPGTAHVCQISPEIAEVTVIVAAANRVRAVAVRLELLTTRWTLTALQTM